MKKLIAGLLAAFLMSAGLVAATSTSSQASCARNYPGGCFDTRTGLTVNPAANGPKRRTFTATVRPVGTNARPVGVFQFRFKRVGGGAQFATRRVPADGRVTLTRVFNNPGIWNVRVTFQGKTAGIFRNSQSGNRQFRVSR